MVRIRLRRTGLRHQPSYRIIVADIESPRDGKFLEILGSYNPTTEPFAFEINEERAYDWMKNGAMPSESVAKIFKSVGLADRYDRYKKGEAIAVLVEEANKAYADRAAKIKA